MIEKVFAALLMFVTVVVGAASVFARLGALHWAGDLFALLPDWYATAALLLLVGFGLLRRWRWAGVAAVLLLLNGWLLLDYVPTAASAQAADAPDLRLMVYNIYYGNGDLDSVVDEIAAHDPDVVFLMEYSYDIQQAIEPQLAHYPYRLIEPSRMTMGLALFSRVPLDNVQVIRNRETRIPVFAATMLVDERPVSFVGGHPWPPMGRWGGLNRAQTEAIGTVAAQAQGPLIVAGDFNLSQWSYALRALMAESDVADARRGFGLMKTWRYAPWLSLPLDHVLVSPQWQVVDYFHGAAGGSDHVPIVLDLQLVGE